MKLSLTLCVGLAKDGYGFFCNAGGQAILVCIEGYKADNKVNISAPAAT